MSLLPIFGRVHPLTLPIVGFVSGVYGRLREIMPGSQSGRRGSVGAMPTVPSLSLGGGCRTGGAVLGAPDAGGLSAREPRAGQAPALLRVAPALGLLLAAAVAQAQTRVTIFGDDVPTPAILMLSKLLGPDYIVRYADAREGGGTAKSIVLAYRFAHRTDYSDLVPTIKAQVAELAPRKVYIALMPSTATDARTTIYPLLRQAAREAGATVVDLSAAKSDAELGEGIYETIVDQRIAKKGWKVVYLDSYEPDEGPRDAAIDGDPNTIWHTAYSASEPKPPHEIRIDFGKRLDIGGFRHVPRQDGGVNGRIKAYELYASEDGKTWGEPIAKGIFADTAEPTTVRLAKPTTARFLRFVALSEQNGGPWTSLAELDVLPPLPK